MSSCDGFTMNDGISESCSLRSSIVLPGARRVGERADVERDVLLLERLQRARVDDARAEVAELDGFAVADVRQQLRVGETLRVGVEHPGHVLPDRHALRVQQVGEDGRAEVRAFASQRRGHALGAAADEPLRHQALRTPEHAGPRRRRRRLRGRPVDPRAAMGVVGPDDPAYVGPRVVEPRLGEMGAHDEGAPDLAERHDLVVDTVDGVRRLVAEECRELRELPREGLFRTSVRGDHRVEDLDVRPAQPLDLTADVAAGRVPPHHLLERVGRLAHGAHDNHEVVGREMAEDVRHVAYAVRVLHAGPAELEHLHGAAHSTP
jgi:hypothetical protein